MYLYLYIFMKMSAYALKLEPLYSAQLNKFNLIVVWGIQTTEKLTNWPSLFCANCIAFLWSLIFQRSKFFFVCIIFVSSSFFSSPVKLINDPELIRMISSIHDLTQSKYLIQTWKLFLLPSICFCSFYSNS